MLHLLFRLRSFIEIVNHGIFFRRRTDGHLQTPWLNRNLVGTGTSSRFRFFIHMSTTTGSCSKVLASWGSSRNRSTSSRSNHFHCFVGGSSFTIVQLSITTGKHVTERFGSIFMIISNIHSIAVRFLKASTHNIALESRLTSTV